MRTANTTAPPATRPPVATRLPVAAATTAASAARASSPRNGAGAVRPPSPKPRPPPASCATVTRTDSAASLAPTVLNGASSRPQPEADVAKNILAGLRAAALKEPSAAIGELKRLHSCLVGASGSSALLALEDACRQPLATAAAQAHRGERPPRGALVGRAAVADAVSGSPCADAAAAAAAAPSAAPPAAPRGGREPLSAPSGQEKALALRLGAQQRELQQLALQQKRLMQRNRELQAECDRKGAEIARLSRSSPRASSADDRPPSPSGRRAPSARALPPAAAAPSPAPTGSPCAAAAAAASAPRAPSPRAQPPPQKPPSKEAATQRTPPGSPEPQSPNGGGGASAASMEAVKAARQELVALRAELEVTSNDVHALLECTPSFVCALSPLGIVTGWNRAATELSGLKAEEVLNRHLVETYVPVTAQEAAADAMERAFSATTSEPLAWEPSEPFELHLSRGGGGGGAAAPTKLQVRAFARRRGDGMAVGLLLLQDDQEQQNEALLARTAGDRRVAELMAVVALRDDELEHLEADIDGLRAELQRHWGATPGEKWTPQRRAASPTNGGARRISFSDANAVATFSRGSSPRSFAKRTQHAELREAHQRSSGNQPARGGGRPPPVRT